MATRYPVSGDRFLRENEELRALLAEAEGKLAEARESLRAFQSGPAPATSPAPERVISLKGAQDDLRALLEVMHEGCATLDARGGVLYCNRRLSDILGIPLDQIIGQPVTKFVSTEDRQRFEQLLAGAREGDPSCTELQFQSSRSNPIPASVTLRAIKSAKPAAFCMVLTDLTEQKKRDELIAAGKLSALILDSAAEAIAVCDEAGTIIAGNDALQRLCGGNPFFQPFEMALPLELVDAAGGPPTLFSISDALNGITLRAQEVQIVRPDLTVTLLLTSAPIKDSSGIVGCVLTMTDISERKSSQEALRESEERLRLFIEYAPVALAMFDFDMRYLYASRRWRSDFGIALDDLRGVSHYHVFPTVPERWKEIHCRAMGGEVMRADAEAFVRRDGSVQWLRWEVRPWREASGKVGGIVIFSEDITTRRQAEEELRLANERFQTALRGSPISVYNQDLELRYTWIYNPGFGYLPAEVIGKRDIDIFERREDAERTEAIKREVVRSGVSRHEEILVRWQNEDRYYDLLVDPLHGPDGSIDGITCAAVEITHRKLADKSLRESEARFRSVLDSSRDIIYRLNVQTGRYEYISPSAHSVVGSILDELNDVDIESSLAMIHPDDIAAMREFVARLDETGEGELEYRQRTRNGTYRWMSNRASLIRDKAGRPLYRNGNIRDITERKQAEDALRESESHFRTLADAIPQLCWMANVDGGIFWYNERWYQYTGTTPEEMEGWGWQTVHDPQVLPETMERWKKCLATGEPLDMVFPLRGADGVFRPFLTRVMPVKDDQGRVVRWFGTNTDISEQKQVEEALRNSERLYRAIGEAIPYGVWVCDPEGRNTYTSESFLKLVGMTQKQCSDFGWALALHPEDAHRAIPAWKECVRTGGIWDVEYRFLGVDGQWHPILMRGVPVRDDRGQIVCWAGINLDIRRLKEAERALVRSEKLASVGRMASTIAHEINNPLETIGNVVYLAMTDGGMPDSAKAHLEIAVQELERINHITRQTLAFHRETSTPTLIELGKSVDTVLKLFESRLRSRGITVERRYRDAGCVTAFGGEIQQVISNLLSNAMDATPDRGRIQFRLSRTIGNRTRFSIADTGSGISPERLARIFEPFFTTKEMYGTGLGLWVTRQILEKHGATIRVRSKIGSGTVFSMVFPGVEAGQTISEIL